MSTAAAIILFAAVTVYAIFGGADFGAGFWDLTAGGAKRDVVVMVGDGSYLMMNSEIATSIQLNHRLIIILLDNRGFGCIERLQNATGNASFNNLLTDSAPRQAALKVAAEIRGLPPVEAAVSALEKIVT